MPTINQRIIDNESIKTYLVPRANPGSVPPGPMTGSLAGLPSRGYPPVNQVLDVDVVRSSGVDSRPVRSRIFVPSTPQWVVKNQASTGVSVALSQPLQRLTAFGAGNVRTPAGNNFYTPAGGLILGSTVPVGKGGLLTVKNNQIVNLAGQIDPSTEAIASVGNRVRNWVGSLTFGATAHSIIWYWDGTHGSSLVTIYRDDQTATAVPAGSILVSGLTPSTNYYFYAYYDEILKNIVFVGSQNGSNGIAWTTATSLAAFQQVGLPNRIAIGVGMLAATTAMGTNTGTGGGSGGANGGRSVI